MNNKRKMKKKQNKNKKKRKYSFNGTRPKTVAIKKMNFIKL
jgi:hypothetical protein